MSDNGSTTPPGWYPDGQGGQRWWDGTQWGPEGQPPAAEPSPPTTPMPTSPPPQYAPPQDPAGQGGYGGPGAPGQAQPSFGTPYAAAAGFPPPGQDPSGGGASGKNTKLVLGIVGGLVGLAVVIVILVLALGGGNGASSDDPAETVSSFFDAARDGDCDAALELLTDNAIDVFNASGDDCESADPAGEFGDDVSLDVGEATIDGDDATVPVTITDSSDEAGDLGLGDFAVDFNLKKTDGVWLIDGFGFGDVDLPDLDLPDASDFPDDPFSDLPDDPFSDLPTDLFSDLPTDLFSDFPSDFDPEDFLSDFPSDFFSDFDPEDYLSDFPSDFLSDLPTG